MIRHRESGYSIVEVMVAILILTIAIVPMFTMFDSGLRSAITSGNYDRARNLVNERLERTSTLSYSEVSSDTYPGGSPVSCGSGCRKYTVSPAGSGLPSGSSYTVSKQFVAVNASGQFENRASETGMLRITVRVEWPEGNSYTSVGLKVR